MKKTLKFVVLSIVMLALVACGTGGGGATEGDTVGFSISTMTNPFFVSMAEGAQAKAKELDVDFVLVDAGDDAAKQISDIEDLIERGIKVLILNPVDSAAVSSVTKTAMEKGIKVVAVDRYVDGVDIDSYIGTDNVKAAETASMTLLDALDDGDDIIVLEGVPGASSAIDRYQGFKNVAEGKVNIVASQTANFNRAEALTVAEDLLKAHPNVKAIYSMNDEMALGALEAIKAAGKTPGVDILVTGFDAGDDAVDAVNAGDLLYTVEQKTTEMGEVSIETAVKWFKGEDVPKEQPIDIIVITKK